MQTTRKAYRVKDNVAHRELAGRVMILLPDDPTLLSLNATGVLLWKGLVKGRSVASLVRVLVSAFEVSPETARQDTEAFLAQLTEAGIIGVK